VVTVTVAAAVAAAPASASAASLSATSRRSEGGSGRPRRFLVHGSRNMPRSDRFAWYGFPQMLRLEQITFACDDAKLMAEFWAEFLDGYTAEGAGESWRAVGGGTTLSFSRMEKSPTIELPIHLDVNVPDREAELQRLLGFGASLVETKSHSVGELSETWTVMRDPEGNGFCIQSPPNALEQRYIGNVTFSCAAPVPLGRFWAGALGWSDEPVDEGFLQTLRDAGMDEREFDAFYVTRNADGSRPRFLFQRREKSRPESYPIQLDFQSDDRESDVERLTRLGASVVETKSNARHTWTVMRDPEGNPFCFG
jgi:predicted enzyme related to lactoylglutathione lyase